MPHRPLPSSSSKEFGEEFFKGAGQYSLDYIRQSEDWTTYACNLIQQSNKPYTKFSCLFVYFVVKKITGF